MFTTTRRSSALALALSLLLCLLAPATASADMAEVPLPEFDHGSIAASYVVCKPDDWNGRKPLPLILDLHGAIAPEKKGANLTCSVVWKKFVEEVPCVVAAPNCRVRGWHRLEGEKGDLAYLKAVLKDVLAKHAIDEERIYLAGFSSGADWAANGGLQQELPIKATWIVCPGPPNVMGIKSGAIERAKKHPFLFTTGEEDYIRKAGAFEAWVEHQRHGGRSLYREVPKVGHKFFGMDEYVRLFGDLERLAHEPKDVKWLELAEGAVEREDYLTAAMHAERVKGRDRRKAQKLLEKLEETREKLLTEAQAIDDEAQPGRAYEAWWRLATQFAGHKETVRTAKAAMEALTERLTNREVLRARRDWFKTR